MSTQSEPSRTPLDEAIDLAKRVRSIDRICQVSGHFQFKLHVMHGAINTQQYEGSAIVTRMEDKITVTVGFRLEGTSEKTADSEINPQPLFEIEAELLAEYTVAEGAVVSDKGLEAFGEINGRFNVSAYWRQYVNDCLSRAGLPPFQLPLFNAAARIAAMKQSQMAASDSNDATKSS